MKSFRTVLYVGLLSLSSLALAQSAPTPAAPTETQKTFKAMKTLAGVWLGSAKFDPAQPGVDGTSTQVSMRVTSSGNAFVHDMKAEGAPDDGSKMGDITLFYLEDDRLILIHYCDFGNRPRMVAKPSPDGKKITFDFLDVSGGTQYGYIHDAVFTIIDANHHTEDWTYFQPGDKVIHAHFDFQRTK
jgi:hypothetical protein